MMARLAAMLLALLAAAACEGNQSVLNPSGPQAERIATLTWWFFAVSGAVYGIVMGVLASTLMRRRRAPRPSQKADRSLVVAVSSAVAITAAILVGLAVASIAAGRGLEAPSDDEPVSVDVIGHQWWWEFQYTNEDHPDQIVDSPNELHLPVGVRVRFRAMSRDVIHSFWAPNLRGKRDLIPGETSESWIQADQAGEYRGQCAEFCGHQHAHMAFMVVAEPMDTFQRWLAQQRAPAQDPQDELASHGKDVFMSGPCVMCHTIRGTDAGSKVGPELTHVASRRFIAAGTLPNTPEALSRWILDAHSVKPGTQMPPNPLNPADLRAVVAYLRTLR
jgi:cytochrome c oxidase subunit II